MTEKVGKAPTDAIVPMSQNLLPEDVELTRLRGFVVGDATARHWTRKAMKLRCWMMWNSLEVAPYLFGKMMAKW